MKERLTAQEQIKEMEKIIDEKAFEYCDSDGCIYSDKLAKILFLAGYRKTVWHKVADGDLPKDNSVVYAFCKNGNYTTALYLNNAIDKESWYAMGMRIDKVVIAWTELPKYEEMNK